MAARAWPAARALLAALLAAAAAASDADAAASGAASDAAAAVRAAAEGHNGGGGQPAGVDPGAGGGGGVAGGGSALSEGHVTRVMLRCLEDAAAEEARAAERRGGGAAGSPAAAAARLHLVRRLWGELRGAWQRSGRAAGAWPQRTQATSHVTLGPAADPTCQPPKLPSLHGSPGFPPPPRPPPPTLPASGPGRAAVRRRGPHRSAGAAALLRGPWGLWGPAGRRQGRRRQGWRRRQGRRRQGWRRRRGGRGCGGDAAAARRGGCVWARSRRLEGRQEVWWIPEGSVCSRAGGVRDTLSWEVSSKRSHPPATRPQLASPAPRQAHSPHRRRRPRPPPTVRPRQPRRSCRQPWRRHGPKRCTPPPHTRAPRTCPCVCMWRLC